MKDKDFRPGDPVTIVLGSRKTIKTFVKEIRAECSFSYPVLTENLDSFTKEGHYPFDDISPSLYHGHNVTVKIEGEEVPKRTVKRRINIRIMRDGSCLVSRYYLSKEAALSAAEHHEEAYNHVFVAKAVEVEVPEEVEHIKFLDREE